MGCFLGAAPAAVKSASSGNQTISAKRGNPALGGISCLANAGGGGEPRPTTMPESTPATPPDVPEKARVPRARAVPTARPFRVAVFFAALHFLGLIATATALAGFFLRPSLLASCFLLGGLVFCAVSWLIAYFKRRAVHCPLCKGTPLINSGALPHIRAHRIRPFNHGTSAVLSILATQKFRCMYCGSDYDLLKPRTRLLPDTGGDGTEESA